MTFTETLQLLEAAGSAQTRKTYARHGVTGECYGVSYATLTKLTKQIKCDQSLAEELWNSGNHDARVLATMIADPAAIKQTTLETWRKSLDNYVLTDGLSKLAAKTKFARKLADKWRKARAEMTATCGWTLLSVLAGDPEQLDDATCRELLSEIERDIHTAANRVRYAMNQTLIVIGIRPGDLRETAFATAERVGPVDVDHGDTSCKTPLATEYIRKTIAHEERAARKSKKPLKKKTAKKKTSVRKNS